MKAPSFKVSKLNTLVEKDIAIDVRNLDLYFARRQVLHQISMQIPRNRVTAIIGPSGCGKSTLIGCFNRMNDLQQECIMRGEVLVGGHNIFHSRQNVSKLRANVGMVFQKPNPFPVSVYENVVYGLRIKGITDRRILDVTVDMALKKAALWHEVKDKLFESAVQLSSGQQQRLVIARALALEPEILLLDEPTSALDPISTLLIEELITELKNQFTVVIVTHDLQQAARVSDYTAFMHQGELIEFTDTDTIFTMPSQHQTEAYITGRYE